jgi:hypothetical protein
MLSHAVEFELIFGFHMHRPADHVDLVSYLLKSNILATPLNAVIHCCVCVKLLFCFVCLIS